MTRPKHILNMKAFNELTATGKTNFFLLKAKSWQLLFAALLLCASTGAKANTASDELLDLSVNLTIYPATCGEENGAITTNVSGGVPPFTYQWSNGQTTTGIVNLAPGTYSVTVTDAINNTATATGIVIGYPPITISSVVVVEATCGNTDGYAIVNVVGNPNNFTFEWSPNVIHSNGPMADSLSSGTYSVTITDTSQPVLCTLVETFTVGNVDGPQTTLVTTGSVCGEDNGSATFDEPGFDYTWSPDLGTPNAEGNIRTDLPAGTYFVTITDPADPGCDNVETVVIEEIPSITAGYTINNLPDCGIANGSVTITASGGSGNYTYSWGNATMNDLAAGVYSVTVTDADTGCTGSVTFTLTDNSGGADLVIDDFSLNCPGDVNGLVNYTVTYDPGFAFPADTIIQNANGVEFTNGNLPPGEYCIVITDANGCVSAGDCFELKAPTQIDVDISIVDATCTAPGAIHVEVTGGAGGYVYEWDPPQNPSGPSATNLAPGSYGVTVTDANGCSVGAGELILDLNCPPEPCLISISSVVVIESSCGNAEGHATVNVVSDPDGTFYQYTWSPNVGSSVNNQAFNLVAGTYSVTIEHPSIPNCSLVETFTVGNSDGPESDYVVTPSVCGVNDGTVTFAEQSFDYAWNPDLGTVVSNYERIDLPAGEYFITITDPANPGCENVITVVVEEISPFDITVTINALPDCGVANGSATINVTGGSGNYSFSWGAQTQDNLQAGVYEVIVTDDDTGCTGSITFVLTVNNPQATLTINSVDELNCSGDTNGFVDFEVNYDAGFSFPADTMIVDADGNVYTNGNLYAGSYCIVITDTNGCLQAGDCFEIENPSQIDVDISIYPAGCDEYGSISLEVTGGAGGYTYSWDPQLPPTPSVDSLTAGTYSVTVTDANGCTAAGNSLVVKDTCPCPDIYLQSVVVIEATCGNADGYAEVNVVGNPDNYIFTWSPNVTNSSGHQAFNLMAGTYSVTIADITFPSNCFIVETFTVGNSDGPEVTYTTTPSDCALNDGTVTFSNPNYEYTWSPDLGTPNGNIRTDLPAGVYFVTIVDPADPDCPDIKTVVVEQTGSLQVDATINQNPDCGLNNGSVTINASGGSGNYSYSWGGQTVTNLSAGIYEVTVTDNETGCTGSVIFVLTTNTPQATVTITSQPTLNCPGDNDGLVEFTVIYDGGFAFPADTIIQDADGNVYTNGNLPAGSFCIVITDANGCVSGGDCFEIAAPTQIDVDISVYDQDCNEGGSIVVEVSGGAGGYVYEWDPPQSPSDSIAENLDPGNYGLTITDANGCEVIVNNLIVEDDCPCPPVIVDGLLISQATCGNADGFAFINVHGGPAGFTYTWSANVTNSSGNFAFDLAAGTYSVTVANEDFPDNCFTIETFTVGNIDGPEVTYVSTPSDCGLSNGTVTFSNPAYEYAWNPDIGTVVSNFERADLPAGEYYITITDPNDPDCPNVITVVVEELNDIVVTVTINQLPDCAMANGSATINVTGGSGDFSYSWGSQTNDNLEAGIYEVIVTDNVTGCQGSVLFSITNYDPQAEVTINSVSEILCPGDEDGTVSYSVIYGGTFEHPATEEIVDIFGNVYQNGTLAPGTYCINVTDANDCLHASECFTIEAPTQINVVVEIVDEHCDSLGSITLVDVNGGAGGYTYTWDPPVSTDTIATGLEPGIYSITITDANGCVLSGDLPLDADTNKITIVLMNDTIICDTSIIIGADIQPPGATVVWTDQDGNPFDPTLPVTPSDTSVYFVEVTSGDCFARDSVIIIEGAVNIVVQYDTLTCFGTDSIITIINLDPGDTLTYDWGPDSLIVIDGNEHTGTPTINPGGAGDYSVWYDVTNQYGCLVNDTLHITVIDSLVVDTIISTMQCDSLTVDFSVNATPGIIYVWNFGDPGNPGGAIGTNPSHDYSEPGCYTVTLIMLPSAGINCFQQDTILHEVCVVDPPIFDMGIDATLDCNENGAELTLGDISTSVFGDIAGWEWIINGDSVSMDSMLVLDIPQSDTLDIMLIVMDIQGCLDTLQETIPINIIDLPFPDTIMACDDDFLQLYSGSDTSFVFEWAPPGIFDDPSSPHAVAFITEDVVITVSISDTSNSFSCPQNDTIQVIVVDPINLMAQGDSLYCDELDAPMFISADCENCDEILIEWSFDDDFNTIEGTGPVLTNQSNPGEPLQTGIYYVRYIDTLGCMDMDSVMLTLDLIPLVGPPDPAEICLGDSVFIFISPLDSVDWIWEGENITFTDNPNEIMVTPTEGQYYVYTVINENGCEATDSAFVDVINIGETNATAEPSEICIYETTQLNVNQIPGATYAWSNGETLNDSTISNPIGTPLETTTYTVTVTDPETGCAMISQVTVTVVHPACEEPYVFFPNAFTPNGDGHNDVLYLRGSDITEVHFIIYNRWGEKMFESNSQDEGWDGTFDGKDLSADVFGFYLRVRCGNGEIFTKKGNVTLLR